MSRFTIELPSNMSLLTLPGTLRCTPGWPALSKKGEVGLTGIYHPNHSFMKNIVESVEFWLLDQTKEANFTMGNISDVVENFYPKEGSIITFPNINSDAKNFETFETYALVPSNYRSFSNNIAAIYSVNYRDTFKITLRCD